MGGVLPPEQVVLMCWFPLQEFVFPSPSCMCSLALLRQTLSRCESLLCQDQLEWRCQRLSNSAQGCAATALRPLWASQSLDSYYLVSPRCCPSNHWCAGPIYNLTQKEKKTKNNQDVERSKQKLLSIVPVHLSTNCASTNDNTTKFCTFPPCCARCVASSSVRGVGLLVNLNQVAGWRSEQVPGACCCLNCSWCVSKTRPGSFKSALNACTNGQSHESRELESLVCSPRNSSRGCEQIKVI